MNKRDRARKALGGLSSPSKMPCKSWSISARRCEVGAALNVVEGSSCFSCYALKGHYVFGNVKSAHERRYRIWKQDRPKWVTNFVTALEGETHFRWFDSGDIQGDEMMADIVEVCKGTPKVRHWLPTKEAWVVEKYRRAHSLPRNLTVRLSLPMVGMKRPKGMKLPTAGIVKAGESCPAKKQGHKCLKCRSCWDPKRKHVTYVLHCYRMK